MWVIIINFFFIVSIGSREGTKRNTYDITSSIVFYIHVKNQTFYHMFQDHILLILDIGFFDIFGYFGHFKTRQPSEHLSHNL